MQKLDPVKLTQDLIKCPSITPHEGGALDFLQNILQQMGFTCHRLLFDDINTPDVDNLYARIGTSGPVIAFAGHTDVVPVGEEKSWNVDPFAGEIKDGKLIGRGAADMKGAIGAFVAAISNFLSTTPNFSGSIALIITGDEEGPSINGTRKILHWMEEQGETFDACIVGEPSCTNNMGDTIKIGRRGSMNTDLTIHGTQGHVAYQHLADNPIPKLMEVLLKLNTTKLDEGNNHFQPSNLEITKVNINNNADNVIPEEASASFNIRFNDQHTSASLKEWIRKTVEDSGYKHTLTFRVSGESFITQPGNLSNLLSQSVEKITGITPELSTGGGTSDARFIYKYSPVVEFGLINETIHQVNEYAATKDIEQLAEIYTDFLKNFFDQ